MSVPSDTRAKGLGRCPICGAPSTRDVRPFCSPRCADIDLGRWASGAYVIAGGDTDGDEDGDDRAAADAVAPANDEKKDG